MSAAGHEHEEVVCIVAPDVSLLRLARALATENLVVRDDADRGVLVIEPAQSAKSVIPADAELGMAWYNGLTKAERALWHRVAGSAVPADAWATFQSGWTLRCTGCGGTGADEDAAGEADAANEQDGDLHHGL